MQLISFMNDVTKSYDHGQQTDVILMDVAKAFDTVPHNRLQQKLKWYSIIGNTYQWISAFLTNRYQRVVIDNAFSEYTAVTSGVTQGTVLGPTLFLIYMNNVADNKKYSKIRLFADDIILYKEVTTTNDAQLLQDDLKSLQCWEQMWPLQFNISKCYVLKITRATKHKINFDYQLHGTPLRIVNI